MAIKVVHYINQFFAGIGGEEKADHPAELRQGHVGPGMALAAAFGEEAEIVATVVCGDSYFNENLETSKAEVLEMIKSQNPDVVIAGPAFNAGRYGVACGTVAKMVVDELNIPVVTAMYEENPGVDMYRKEVYILPTANSAAGMRKAVKPLAAFALKLAKGEEILSPAEDGYFERGARVNYFTDKIGGERAVDMLVAKLTGTEFTTEYPMPTFDNVEPGKAIKDMSKAKIAVVTSGGIVPSGNPDRIESSSASKYGEYSLEDRGETAHGGYDPVYANERPDRVMGIDCLQDMVTEGLIGSLHEFYYTTTGNGTSVKNSDAFGTEIGQKLLAAGVDAVILTSTWGTCTRCGATMVKAIERTGLPVVHICTVVPISLTVGANRIVPAIAIPFPLGNPKLDAAEEKKLRRGLIEKCVNALTVEVTEQTVFDK